MRCLFGLGRGRDCVLGHERVDPRQISLKLKDLEKSNLR